MFKKEGKEMGQLVRTFPLTGYPTESQEIMFKIVKFFEDNLIKVIKYKGSYSITDKFSATVIKVICTIGSDFSLSGAGVAVLFRKELLEKDLNKVNEIFPFLKINSVSLTVGGGNYEDFYYTRIDSEEMFNDKSEDILGLGKKILN